VAQEETSPLQPEDKPAGTKRQEPLPNLPAPVPRLSPDEPVSGPVTLAYVDPELAKEMLDYPFALAASLYPEVDAERLVMVVDVVIDRVCSRSRAGGDSALSITELAALTGLSSGSVEDLLAQPITQFAQMVVRGTFAKTTNRIFYEQLESFPAATGRRHNGEGTEKVPGIARNQLRIFQHSAAGSGKHCSIGNRPLLVGTRWDLSCDRFGVEFPDWALERKAEFLVGFAQHVKAMLGSDREVRGRALAGLRNGKITLPGTITKESVIAAISRYLLIGPIRYGTSLVPYRDHLDVFNPGGDDATVREVTAPGRSTALARGAPSLEERLEFEEEAEIITAGKLPSMYELGITPAPGVQYRWSPMRHELMRYAGGEGARIDWWRLVGVEQEKHFWRTLTMIERHAQVTWTGDCTARAEADCLPGKLQAHLPEQCAAMRAILDMANAGIVDAVRSGQLVTN
jgi:hypothetical protein